MAELKADMSIEKLEIRAKVEEKLNKEGEVEERRLRTKITFEVDGYPEALRDILYAQESGVEVKAMIYSKQGYMAEVRKVAEGAKT